MDTAYMNMYGLSTSPGYGASRYAHTFTYVFVRNSYIRIRPE